MSEHEFAMGALAPSGFEWQEGKTVGEITLISFLLKARAHLLILEDKKSHSLAHEATSILVQYGVEEQSNMHTDVNGKTVIVNECGEVIGRQG